MISSLHLQQRPKKDCFAANRRRNVGFLYKKSGEKVRFSWTSNPAWRSCVYDYFTCKTLSSSARGLFDHPVGGSSCILNKTKKECVRQQLPEDFQTVYIASVHVWEFLLFVPRFCTLSERTVLKSYLCVSCKASQRMYGSLSCREGIWGRPALRVV